MTIVLKSPPNLQIGKKRKRISLTSAMKITNCFVRSYMKQIENVQSDNRSLPFKKRKIVEKSSNKDPEIEEMIYNFMTKLTIDDDIREFPVIPKIDLPFRITEISKNIYKLLQTDKLCLKIRPKVKKLTKKICFPAKKQETVTLITVLNLFKNCVNFIQPRGCTPIADIDIIVRSFSDFGKVLTIQDHWVQIRGSSNEYPCRWAGALVTYKTEKDRIAAFKGICVRQPSITAIHLVNHLYRIHILEFKWTTKFENSKSEGTTIIVEEICRQASRTKLNQEFSKYGKIKVVNWNVNNSMVRRYSCEVTYVSTVSAVAAALALDGKNIQKSRLRTKIKITAKEWFIHRKLCEIF